MEIEISILKNILIKLLDHLEETGVEKVIISKDYYWHIPTNQIYDPYVTPTKFLLGQLSDDWSDLQKMNNGEYEPTISDFNDLAAIFRAIGGQFKYPSKKK